MKKAGDILSKIIDELKHTDEGFIAKAQGYSKFFDSWADITAKNGIASAADHSRIKDLERGIVLIEMDHPGWKQIIQTKQSKLLYDFRYRFPELDISGISLVLGYSGQQGKFLSAVSVDTEERTENETAEGQIAQTAAVEEQPKQFAVTESAVQDEPALSGYDAIKDEEFREKLMALGKVIAAQETHV
jgi:hypothetical protein